MPRLDFEKQLEAARVWEQRFAAWARTLGYWVLPTYDFSGKGDDKAPKLLAPVGAQSLVLPDLQCFRDGEGRWVECKYKSRADDYRVGGYRVTGIQQRLWRHYRGVQEVTKASVTIAFLHAKEDEIRIAKIDDLAESGKLYSHTYLGTRMRGPMIFWRYDSIPLHGPLSALTSREAA